MRARLSALATALLGVAFAAFALPAVAASRPATPAPITVYAAASLTDVLGELGKAYTRRTGVPVKFSFAASSLLARQIEAGARADVYFSADEAWMDYLDRRGLVARASRRDVAGNRLALIAPADSTVALKAEPGFALAAALGRGRLATADPDGVPAGRYARAALTSLGVWNAVADRLVRAEDVRSALAFVARGEAPLGIVYATDARADRRVRIVTLFPAASHPPIAYPAALTTHAGAGAAAFLDFLGSETARAAFERFGFVAAR